MSESFIPYGRQSIDEQDIQAVIQVLRGDYLTTGPMVAQFERRLCEISGAKAAVAVNSGTAALHAAYYAAGLEPGQEIITSPLTFAATANAARYLGANVRFVDIDPATGLIDPAQIEQAITPRTRLIAPVDYSGQPADYDAINAIASRHGLAVVADAAHSLGATYKGRPVGTLATLTTTSFHPVKPVTTAEGGAVLTPHENLASIAARFRTHGITRDPALLQSNQGPWWYEMQELGYNYRLPDLNCALGLSQLGKLDQFLTRRRQIAAMYDQGLSHSKELILPHVNSDVVSGWHLYVVRLAGDASRRRAVVEALHQRKIGVQVHYIPVHLQPYYQSLGFKAGMFPQAEDFYSRCFSLPIFPAMTDEQVGRVIDNVLGCVNNAR